ncbi:hypothetical protein [Pseudomonas sp. UMC65]|uniref:hypothetical protein n=1 Tax=Pseudomonas sp. UMC65 TaxID=1862323 RepID=UPI001601FC30|nr:hypothetical protein [Pseudomonas sp. UMC65]
MTDCELLLLAAKAIGGECLEIDDPADRLGASFYRPDDWSSGHFWNPLVDDGDALRLAAYLGFELSTDSRGVGARTTCGASPSANATAPECSEAEHLKQIRRCIVRAAAEIGKTMP